MEEHFVENVVSLYEENRWREILDLNANSKNEVARKLLWVWPSESNLQFICENVKLKNCKGIVSIGCGCGLLEWLFHCASRKI